MRRVFYRILFVIARVGLFFWHPVFRVKGREHVPQGGALICSNHASSSDPLWILFALNEPDMIRALAKDELRKVPLVGWLLKTMGVFFVKRGAHDVKAFRQCQEALAAGDKLMVFIEGTRWRKHKDTRARTGSVRMAARSGAPLVPVYVTRLKKPFRPVEVCFGAPRDLSEFAEADHDALQRASDEILYDIYRMGGDDYADHIGENSGLLLRR